MAKCTFWYWLTWVVLDKVQRAIKWLYVYIVRGRLYISCVWNSMLSGSVTWPVRKENGVALQRAEMRMVRWMCGTKPQGRVVSKGLREREIRIRWHSLGNSTQQVAMVWGCVARRRQWLGEEMYEVWGICWIHNTSVSLHLLKQFLWKLCYCTVSKAIIDHDWKTSIPSDVVASMVEQLHLSPRAQDWFWLVL